MAVLDVDVLNAQDDVTSSAVIELLKDDEDFKTLSKKELDQLLSRDQEDADKLQAGVDEAIKKGVLPGDLETPGYQNVDVLGKSADEVANIIREQLPEEGGCVMILVGLSGTGKGTTVSKLQQAIPGATSWSNGNCFRSLTLLAATHCDQEGIDFDKNCLTAENLKKWAGMLEFGKFGGKFDIRINGLGIDALVSDISTTKLQEPRVAKNIPTVAKETQGEVVMFAGDAVKKMGDAGTVVLLEGREQTLNFIPSPHRFCLTMSDTSVIGARRAAQRVGAHAKKTLNDAEGVEAAVRASLKAIAAE